MGSIRHALIYGIFAVGLGIAGAAAHAQVAYRYDDLGRLIQAIATDGKSVQYRYDAVGNILGIQRYAANALSVAGFSPGAGSPGTSVTIYGSGFSATPGANTVTFNSISAVVSAASATTLIATVPSGASTGKVAVVIGAGTAQSANNFVVKDSNAPAITTMSPDIGGAGTVVTLTGSNFQTVPERNNVRFGGVTTSAVLSAPQSTSLQVAVPPSGLPAGPIAITTPAGNASGTADFYVLPAGVVLSDIAFRTRIVLGGGLITFSIPAAPAKALILFSGQKGQFLNGVTSGGTFATAVTANVYGPEGLLIGPIQLANAGAGDLGPPLRSTGTHSLLLSNTSTAGGGITLGLVPDIEGGVLVVDGAPAVTVAEVGQDVRYTFSASAGSNVLIDFAPTWAVPPSSYGVLHVRNSTSTYQASSFFWDSVAWTLSNLPTTGIYDLFVSIPGAAAGQIQVRVVTAPPP